MLRLQSTSNTSLDLARYSISKKFQSKHCSLFYYHPSQQWRIEILQNQVYRQGFLALSMLWNRQSYYNDGAAGDIRAPTYVYCLLLCILLLTKVTFSCPLWLPSIQLLLIIFPKHLIFIQVAPDTNSTEPSSKLYQTETTFSLSIIL